MPVKLQSVALLVALACLTIKAVWADDKAHPYRDYLVQSYPAQMQQDLPRDSLESLPRSFKCESNPVTSLLESVIPDQTDNRTAYVIHIGKWESRSGVYAMKSSHWYVYRMLRRPRQNPPADCTFEQTGFNADGTPLIYADKKIWLIGINYFDHVDPATISLGYKLANVPVPPQNIQDLGALIAGALGVTPPTPGAGAQTVQVSAPAPTAPSFVTVAGFDFIKRFPESLTFSFSLSVNQVGALPPARIGVPYSGSVSASGGSGAYTYEIVNGTLPSGIGLDSNSGVISGTPIAAKPGSYVFWVRASDTSEDDTEAVNDVKVEASLDLYDSFVVQPFTITSTNSALPPASSCCTPQPAVAAPPIKPGETSVSSTPTGAQVQIDGQSKGEWVTPFNVVFQSGLHALSVSKAGFITANLTINAASGSMPSVSVQLIPAITVQLPDARVDAPYSVILIPPAASPAVNSAYTLAFDSGLPKPTWVENIPPHTSLIQGTPGPGSEGPVQLTIDVFDSSTPPKLVAVLRASLNVWPLSTSPSQNAIRLPDATVGQVYPVTGLALGSLASNGNITFMETGDVPMGISFSPSSGSISGTPVDPRDGNRTFFFSVQIVPSLTNQPSGQSAPSVSGNLLFSLHVLPPAPPQDQPDATVDLSGGTSFASFRSSIDAGQQYSATVRFVGPDGKYLILFPCRTEASHRRGKRLDDPGCTAKRWFNLPPSFTLRSLPNGRVELDSTAEGGGEVRDDSSLDLETIPWTPGKTDVAVEICKARSLVNAAERSQATGHYSEQDCDSTVKVELDGEIDVQALPLQRLTVTLGATSSQPPANTGGPRGTSQGLSNGTQSSNPSTASQNAGGPSGSGNQGKNSGNASGAASSPINPQPVDCSIVSSQAPCTFTDTFVNSDREAFDFSIGVSLPGTKEAQYSPAQKIVTHTDLYALVDLYPLAIIQHFADWSWTAYMPSKESWLPHFNFGIPIASQPFHRPSFAIAENLTTWTKAEKYGFPIRINAFVGIVSMKQQINATGTKYDRAWKPICGIEVPVSSLVSKLSSSLSGSGSKSGSTTGKSGQ
jgi:hypothetical protein